MGRKEKQEARTILCRSRKISQFLLNAGREGDAKRWRDKEICDTGADERKNKKERKY